MKCLERWLLHQIKNLPVLIKRCSTPLVASLGLSHVEGKRPTVHHLWCDQTRGSAVSDPNSLKPCLASLSVSALWCLLRSFPAATQGVSATDTHLTPPHPPTLQDMCSHTCMLALHVPSMHRNDIELIWPIYGDLMYSHPLEGSDKMSVFWAGPIGWANLQPVPS